MESGELEDHRTVTLVQREVIAHTEDHHGADGSTQEACGLGDDAANAHSVHPGTGTGQIQGQGDGAHDQQRRGQNLFHNCGRGGVFACVGRQNSNDRERRGSLRQIQHAHPVRLISTEEDHKQRNAQHTRFLGAEQLRQVVIRELLFSCPECPEGSQQHQRQNQAHAGQCFGTQIRGQHGIEHHAGQTEVHNKLLHALDALRLDQLLALRKNAQEDGHKNGHHYLRNRKYFIHKIYVS